MEINFWILAALTVGICIVAWLLSLLSKQSLFKRPKWLSSSNKKIKIEEMIYVDPKTRLVLVGCNNENFLILLGANNDLLFKIGERKSDNYIKPENTNATVRPESPLPVEELLRAMR